jgi:hypothetical protein
MDCIGMESIARGYGDVVKKGHLDFCFFPSYGVYKFRDVAEEFGLSWAFELFFCCVNRWARIIGGTDAILSTSGEDFLSAKLQEKKERPLFFFIYAGANHSNPHSDMYQDPKGFEQFEKSGYQHIRQEADAKLMALLEIIHQVDPGALIVLIGDHGPRRYRGVASGEGDVNNLIRSRGLNTTLASRDAVGVFCAIKWPVPSFSEGKVISHVNIFRHIFAALTEDPSLLEQCEPNVSYVSEGHRFSEGGRRLFKVAQEGTLLESWENFTYPPN